MASVRARRPRQPAEQGKSKRRGAAPQGPTPRMAAMHGALEHVQRPNWSWRGLGMSAIGVLLIGGLSVAGAAWAGGSLFDARQAFNVSSDALAANVGFSINENSVRVRGVEGMRADEVRAVINPDGRRSLLALDPQEVRARVEGLGWVKTARVRRVWPSHLDIRVERREALALWREDGEISVIDSNGERLLAERAADNTDLPLVEGAGAGPVAAEILFTLQDLPHVRERVAHLVRVGDRRWDLELRNGAVAMLPENELEMHAALRALEQQQINSRLLDRAASFDLRLRGLISVRLESDMANGLPLGERGA